MQEGDRPLTDADIMFPDGVPEEAQPVPEPELEAEPALPLPKAMWIDQPEDGFEALELKRLDPLPVPKRQWLNKETIRYRVYSSETDSVVVEANSASRAIAASGVLTPYKVERYQPEYDLRLHEEEATPADLHVDRQVLDVLTDESPVLSHQIVRGLDEAGQDLEAAEEAAANESPMPEGPELEEPELEGPESPKPHIPGEEASAEPVQPEDAA